MSEFDRFLRSAEFDRHYERRLARLDEVAVSRASRRAKLKSLIKDLMLLVFNEPMPCGRLSAICGRTEEYWQIQLSARSSVPTKAAVKLLTAGLRAHLFGLRDHLSDIERNVLELVTLSNDATIFFQPRVRSSRNPLRRP